jgi:hypothetical protein
MPVRWSGAAILHIVTALVTGFVGLRVMFTPLNVGRFYWWPLITFGAPLLLLIGGILILFPHVKRKSLVALVGTVLFVVWVAFIHDLLWTFLVFAVAVVLVAWSVLAISSAAKRDGLVSLIASSVLALSWVPISIDTFRLPSQNVLQNLAALFPLLFIWGLIIGSVISGFIVTKSPRIGTIKNGRVSE